MTNKLSVGISVIVHALLRVTIFIEQRNDCSPAPKLASWIFLISIVFVLCDLNIYPVKYQASKNTIFQILFETIMSTLLIELSSVIVWCNLERNFYKLMKCILLQKSSNMYYDMGGDALCGFLITVLSIGFLAGFLEATRYSEYFRRQIEKFYKILSAKVIKFVKKMSKYTSNKSATHCDPNACANETFANEEDGWCFGNMSGRQYVNTRRRRAMGHHNSSMNDPYYSLRSLSNRRK